MTQPQQCCTIPTVEIKLPIMHQVHVKDQGQIPRAILWCKRHLSKSAWNIQTNWPQEGFVFMFNNTRDATWFGLHWVQ